MKKIRIGTRSSELACWQAQKVSEKLLNLGYSTELVKISSKGDIVLDKPLYEIGVVGLFTKTLDIALLNGEVDIVVHSLKDVPTQLPKGIIQAAVLERGSVQDIVALHPSVDQIDERGKVATSSLRRRAQWLNKYPNAEITDLRGNVNLRMQKLAESNWNGAIFAKAGLERINILPEKYKEIDWMVPAPAQGAVMVACLDQHEELKRICALINHEDTMKCVKIEREFLRKLEGGCTAPIGAYACVNANEEVVFKGCVLSIDGKEKITVEQKIKINNIEGFGETCAEIILNKGGKALMADIKAALKK
ncbi:MAG: hydroxymethylbilane synthase [Flavobacteriales bacterium]|jgi:hydroxymethylbilane synthase|nr:hydroxymethylbilane synthase [Flavobacteriales bacterium]